MLVVVVFVGQNQHRSERPLPDPLLPDAPLPDPLLPESMGLAVPFDRLINDVEFGSNACNATMHA